MDDLKQRKLTLTRFQSPESEIKGSAGARACGDARGEFLLASPGIWRLRQPLASPCRGRTRQSPALCLSSHLSLPTRTPVIEFRDCPTPVRLLLKLDCIFNDPVSQEGCTHGYGST